MHLRLKEEIYGDNYLSWFSNLFLNTEITLAILRLFGTIPVEKVVLNIISMGFRDFAVSFFPKIWEKRFSGPLQLIRAFE